jgi:hypothetical protein
MAAGDWQAEDCLRRLLSANAEFAQPRPRPVGDCLARLGSDGPSPSFRNRIAFGGNRGPAQASHSTKLGPAEAGQGAGRRGSL